MVKIDDNAHKEAHDTWIAMNCEVNLHSMI